MDLSALAAAAVISMFAAPGCRGISGCSPSHKGTKRTTMIKFTEEDAVLVRTAVDRWLQAFPVEKDL